MTNSKQKGKRGELQFANLLKDHGFVARRGQQFKGGADSPDVICESLPDIHFEIKNCERLNLWDAMYQSASEMGSGQIPVVAWKRNRKNWLVTMRIEDWIDWAKAHIK